MLCSDGVVFRLDGRANAHNAPHWSVKNHHWLEKSLTSPKTMVWAAIEDAGVIGLFFFDANVDENLYLKMLKGKFFTEFCRLRNAPDIFFLMDVAKGCQESGLG